MAETIETQLILARKAMFDLLGIVDSVEIEKDYLNYDGEFAQGISFDGGRYVIYRGECIHELLGAVGGYKYDGFLVDVATVTPGGYWEPDSVDVSNEYQSLTFTGALHFVIQSMMRDRLAGYFEYLEEYLEHLIDDSREGGWYGQDFPE